MNKEDRIYIAGHNGMVGSSLKRLLSQKGFVNILTRNHEQLDLTNQSEVSDFFNEQKPDYVFLSAAKVGGISANNTYPAEFIYSNLMIESNVINSSYVSKVKRLLFLGSSCVYPRNADQPMSEKAILTGVLEQTNEPYALAKIAGIKLCESYNRQYDTDYRSVMPSNLYGINDNFNLNDSHVIPALMRRFHEAKINNLDNVEVWGSGSVMREFLFVDDMADASFFVMNLTKEAYQAETKPMLSHVNIGVGKDITIRYMAELMKDVVDFKGSLTFDTSKPDGARKKLLDTSLLSNLGWNYNVELQEGLEKTYEWYLLNMKEARNS